MAKLHFDPATNGMTPVRNVIDLNDDNEFEYIDIKLTNGGEDTELLYKFNGILNYAYYDCYAIVDIIAADDAVELYSAHLVEKDDYTTNNSTVTGAVRVKIPLNCLGNGSVRLIQYVSLTTLVSFCEKQGWEVVDVYDEDSETLAFYKKTNILGTRKYCAIRGQVTFVM